MAASTARGAPSWPMETLWKRSDARGHCVDACERTTPGLPRAACPMSQAGVFTESPGDTGESAGCWSATPILPGTPVPAPLSTSPSCATRRCPSRSIRRARPRSPGGSRRSHSATPGWWPTSQGEVAGYAYACAHRDRAALPLGRRCCGLRGGGAARSGGGTCPLRRADAAALSSGVADRLRRYHPAQRRQCGVARALWLRAVGSSAARLEDRRLARDVGWWQVEPVAGHQRSAGRAGTSREAGRTWHKGPSTGLSRARADAVVRASTQHLGAGHAQGGRLVAVGDVADRAHTGRYGQP